MKYLVKMLSVLAVATTVLSGINAVEKEHQYNKNQDHIDKNHQMMSAYNSPARLDVEGAWDFYASADLIYWQPSEQNLAIGASVPTSPTNVTGIMHQMDFKFKPGFKAGLGMHFDHDNWGLFAEYTWLHMSESTSQLALATTTLNPLWSTYIAPMSTITKIVGNWSLNTNLFDLELGRPYYVGTKLVFKPTFGMRVLWFDQKMNVQNHYGTDSIDYDKTDAKQSSWGIGPRITLDTDFLLGCGFRLLGKSAFSLGYQSLKSSFYENEHGYWSTGHANLKNKLMQVTANPEVGVGLAWGRFFSNNNWHFDLAATYDFQMFFSQNMMRDLIDQYSNAGWVESSSAYGNLFFQGLTIKAQLNF
jgi:hypothetical protein